MAKILLKDNSTGENIVIDDSLILKAFTSNSITNVTYLREEDGYMGTFKVTDSLTSVGNQSDLLFSTTDVDGNVVWLNSGRVLNVYDINSLATIEFDGGGAIPENFRSGATAVAVKSAIITKEGDFSYLVDSFTASPNTILLDSSVGDVESKFVSGGVFTVFGEGDSNDGIYTISSASYDGANTTITVVETPTANASASGYVWVKASESSSSVSYDPGIANTGVTATHYSGDGKNFVTKLVVNQADALTLADNAALADGYLLYTFPAGAYSITAVKMDMGVTAAEDTTATPDVGLGSVIASGAVNVLSGTATFEDYLTGQTAADANGTNTLKTLASAVVVEAAAAHTLHFNVADTWADTAGADLTADIAGEVWFQWALLD